MKNRTKKKENCERESDFEIIVLITNGPNI